MEFIYEDRSNSKNKNEKKKFINKAGLPISISVVIHAEW